MIIDINFHFGGNYYDSAGSSFWVQIFIQFVGGLFGFLAALFIFNIGQRKDRKKELKKQEEEKRAIQNKKEQKNKDKIQYFKFLLENVLNAHNKQKEQLLLWIEVQKKDLLSFAILGRVTTYDFKRILLSDNNDFFVAYGLFFGKKEGNWIDNYNNLSKSLDFIEDYRQEMFRITDNNMNECHDNQVSAKNFIDNIPAKLASYALKLKNELGESRKESPVYQFIDGQIKKYYDLIQSNSNSSTDLNEINKQYLKPLIDEILANYIDQPWAEDIMVLCRGARGELNSMKHAMRATIDELEKLSPSSAKNEETLKKNIEKIKDVLLTFKEGQ